MTQDSGQKAANELPLVSVAMTAYHSAAWLPRAIDSVFRQQTEFRFELVLGDDCSHDGTAAVLDGLREKYSPCLRVLPRSHKLGMQRNYYDVFEHCRGEYIAWLDADDYWTDPRKLERQVHALQADQSISVCGHFVRHVSPAGTIEIERFPNQPPGRYNLAQILANNIVPSPSIMFRNGVQRSLPSSFFELTGMVDWPILLQAAHTGDILLLDGVMADYTLNPSSAYQGKGRLYQDERDLEFYDWVAPTLPARWQRSIHAARGIRQAAISYHLLQQGKLQEARRAAYRALREPYLFDNLSTKFKPLLMVEMIATWPRLQRIFQR